MFILYDLIFLLFAVFYLPVFLFKKKMHAGFLSRLGLLSRDLKLERPVWMHAVSVGEAVAVKHLIENLRLDFPDKRFVISTVTPTGNKIARDIAVKGDLVTYLPLDLSFIVRPVIARINPAVFVIVETEIWPNLIGYLYSRDIPVIVVNGRISDASFKKYLWIKFLLKPVLNKIHTFCVQSERDKERLIALGMSSVKIKVTGNMKFDIKIRDYAELRKDYTDYRLRFGLGPKDRLLLAASTHAGEEAAVLKIYNELLAGHPKLRLLIAPRHPERAQAIEKTAAKFNLVPSRISFFSSQADAAGRPEKPQDRKTVFILDTVGQLMYFYAISDIVFVGGSLVKKGGHNILEPASLGKPILFGAHMFNFRDIANLFLSAQAALSVANPLELKEKIEYLLGDENRLNDLGRLSKEIILANQGATLKNQQVLREILNNARDIL